MCFAVARISLIPESGSVLASGAIVAIWGTTSRGLEVGPRSGSVDIVCDGGGGGGGDCGCGVFAAMTMVIVTVQLW